MKKSALKSFIREEVINTLSEEQEPINVGDTFKVVKAPDNAFMRWWKSFSSVFYDKTIQPKIGDIFEVVPTKYDDKDHIQIKNINRPEDFGSIIYEEGIWFPKKWFDELNNKGYFQKLNQISEETIIATQSGTSSDATSDQKQQASKLTSKGETVKFVKKGQTIKENNPLDKYTIQVNQKEEPQYKGTIKRISANSWVMYDEDGSKESGNFNSLESLMSYFDLKKSDLSGDYVQNLKENKNISWERINSYSTVGSNFEKYETPNYRIVRFAYNDTGDNAFALLDLNNKKVISYSISGRSEFDKFNQLKNSPNNQEFDTMGLSEMARTSNNVKLGDIGKFEKAQKIYGDTWVGKMLQAIKDAGDNGLSQNELVSIAGKKAFAEINPTIKEFVTIGVLAKTREKAVEKPKDEEPETPESSIEEPKQEKPDSEYFIDDKDEEAPIEKTEEPESKEEEPPVNAIKGAEKEVGGKTYAKKLSPEDEDKYARIKKGIESKVKKLADMTKAKRTESDDLKLLKQLIARDDVKKLFKAKGVSIKDIVAGVIS